MKRLNKKNVAFIILFIVANAIMLGIIFFLQPGSKNSSNSDISSSGAVTIISQEVNLFNDVYLEISTSDDLKTHCNQNDCFMTIRVLNDDGEFETISFIKEFTNKRVQIKDADF